MYIFSNNSNILISSRLIWLWKLTIKFNNKVRTKFDTIYVPSEFTIPTLSRATMPSNQKGEYSRYLHGSVHCQVGARSLIRRSSILIRGSMSSRKRSYSNTRTRPTWSVAGRQSAVCSIIMTSLTSGHPPGLQTNNVQLSSSHSTRQPIFNQCTRESLLNKKSCFAALQVHDRGKSQRDPGTFVSPHAVRRDLK